MTSRLDSAAYLVALGYLRGVGGRTVVSIARAFPTYDALAAASDGALEAALSARAASAVRSAMPEWNQACRAGLGDDRSAHRSRHRAATHHGPRIPGLAELDR